MVTTVNHFNFYNFSPLLLEITEEKYYPISEIPAEVSHSRSRIDAPASLLQSTVVFISISPNIRTRLR